METIIAKEFLVNTFETDFLTEEEIDTIATAMNLFAKGKCKEQRGICNFHAKPIVLNGVSLEDVRINEESILNAPEPTFK